MKKNGFTLIELIITIALIMAIALLVVPKVQNIIDDNKEKAHQSMIESIEDAAEAYVYLNTNEVNNQILENGYVEVSILTLQVNDLLSTDLKNPITDEILDNSIVVRITKDDLVYNYEINFED